MTTTYRLHVNDLSVEVINSIKVAFKDKIVEMAVSDEIKETNSSFHFWSDKAEDIYEDYLNK